MQGNRTSVAKEQIMGKIRKALQAHSVGMPFPEADHWDASLSFTRDNITPEELFAIRFTELGGQYAYCANELELLEQINALYESRSWSRLFCSDQRLLQICMRNKLDFILPSDNADDSADACITGTEALVARTGSFLISSRQHLGRVSPVFYPVHIVVAYRGETVYDIEDGLLRLKDKYHNALPSMISLQTGPSRTADIEKTLVTGVHGPKEVFCFYVDAE